MITSNEHHLGALVAIAALEVLVAMAPGVAWARGYRGAEMSARVPDT